MPLPTEQAAWKIFTQDSHLEKALINVVLFHLLLMVHKQKTFEII